MNLKPTTLSGGSQLRKATRCVVPFVWNGQKRQIQRQKQEVAVYSWGWGAV